MTHVAVGLVLIAACSGGSSQLEIPISDTGTIESPLQQIKPDDIPLIEGPVSPEGFQAIFATPDLGLGEHRVGFVLISADGLVKEPQTEVSSLYFPSPDSEGELKQTSTAVFRLWPYGTRGLYTTTLDFDVSGNWGIEIEVMEAGGTSSMVQLMFEVAETPKAVAAGSQAIPSLSKTLADVQGIAELTTGSLQDPDLYQISIADAIKSNLPTVIVMASPAFCTNAVCGPQVEVLQEIKDKYAGESNFIHVDIYDNPQEIQGDLNLARLSATVLEWRLPSTEWTFVVDKSGTVAARFESFATFEEVETALLAVF